MISSEVARLSACFTAASLFEVCICPSPGLVSPLDNGAHDDMNLFTFVLGSSTLAPYYTEFARLGFEYAGESLPELFLKLRAIGMIAEKELLQATEGVNTQRGQLFVLGLAAGVAGYCRSRGIDIPSTSFFDSVRDACQGLSERELISLAQSDARTTGERLYLSHGYRGVRGESESGFPAVQHTGYPALRMALDAGLGLNDASVHCLVSIMSVLDDTTVIGRGGEEGLREVKESGKAILSLGSVFTPEGRAQIVKVHHLFCRRRLSPGGAADLLALSLALHFASSGFPPRSLLLAPSLFAR